jgi:hypothetical protein
LNNPTPHYFTAAQIATALGMKRQAIQWHLRAVEPATRNRIVNGAAACAWTQEQLPTPLRERLAAASVQQRCRSVEGLLTMPRRQWQPAIPLDKICEADIQSATLLREALRPWLIRQHEMKPGELKAAALASYRQHFGHEITGRYLDTIWQRIVQWDSGFEDWNRLEIYLPDRPKEKAAPAAVVDEALAADFAELESFITACSQPHAPSPAECAGVWTLALEKFTALVNVGESEKSAARRVRQFLSLRASFLASSRDALWVAWKRKLATLHAAAGDVKALRDGRAGNGAAFDLPENDRHQLIHRAVFYYRGDIAPAWRDLLRQGFSPETVARYAGRAVKKSHVPASIRESIVPEVEVLTVMYQGPRALDAIKGHVTRSYAGFHSLEVVSGDDFTMNTYFYIPDGKGGFELTRGQVILFIDWRSQRILGWALEPKKSYSSLTIRGLCTKVFSEFGVPNALYFERGVWNTATLLKGKTDPLTFTEISQGLREFGIKFHHAIRPRTKTVERIGGMFQDLAEAEPGYCGRNEREDAPESLRKQMAEVATGKVHPTKYFYSLDQWNKRIGELVERYNAEPQQGIILNGLSPEQGFEKFLNRENPPMQFTPDLRYLLAHDKRRVSVTMNGVTIQVGKQKFNYLGREISHLVGREALLWFDPTDTEIAVVTDLDRANPICVERSKNPNVLETMFNPGSQILAGELARIEGQAAHMKTLYTVVKAKFPLPQRQLLANAQAVAIGAEIAVQREAITQKEQQKRKQRGLAQRLAQRTGIMTPERTQSRLTPERAKRLADFIDGNVEETPGKESK